MEFKTIRTSAAPLPIGPYSQAVLASGKFLFLAGQIPLDPATGALVAGDIRQQTRQVCENIGAVLKESSASFANVVRTTVFLLDMNEFGAMNEVYAEYFGGESPARSTVQVARLPRDAKVEIEVVAVV